VIIVANSLIERLDQTGLSAGQFDYALFVRNASHYYAWGRRIGFESTGTTTVPLASLSASPKAGKAPLSVHFAGGAIDPSGLKSLQFSWDFGDGGTAAGPTADHVYMISGEYTARLTVTNTLGQSAEATTRIIVSSEANWPPTAIIAAYPTSGDAPLVVIFEGAGTDLDGTVERYEWNFGDGFTAIGQVVEHTYIIPGTYGATLTVTDNQGGTGIVSELIKVTGPGTTAAQTAPPDMLETPPECGTGLPMAAVGTLIGMFGLMTLRRRR
jgi:PKD repeat protein